MRIIFLAFLTCFALTALATAPAATTTTTPTTPGGDNFGMQVQQNTSQAQQVFQNVNYKNLSGQQDQNYFFGDDDESPDMSDLAKQFKLAPEN